jgi:hypothetical protein
MGGQTEESGWQLVLAKAVRQHFGHGELEVTDSGS